MMKMRKPVNQSVSTAGQAAEECRTRREILAGAVAAATAACLPLRFASAVPATQPAAAGVWRPIALASAANLDAMHRLGLEPVIGGEGGQQGRSLAASPDGQLVVWGTDVGGIYRSVDAGATFEPCNVGYTPRGCTSLAIDPRDPTRVLAMASNSSVQDFHGLYLSEDGCGSWRHVLPLRYAGNLDFRRSLAFDPTSDRCYWSSLADDEAIFGDAHPDPSLFRSNDRGVSWHRLPDSEFLGGGEPDVDPRDGTLWVAAPTGLHVSRDGAESFVLVREGPFTGITRCRSRPDVIYACTKRFLLQSNDGGTTWDEVGHPQDVENLRDVSVNPHAPAVLMIEEADESQWQASRFVSHDSGTTWRPSNAVDENLNFLPYNRRVGLFCWSPVRRDVLHCAGGDWPAMSVDAGRTYNWRGNGVNNILVGGHFHFSPADPDIVLLTSQDYDAALTTDGGHTWRYLNASGTDWGGYCYAGLAVDATTLLLGNSDGWGKPRVLRISRDGGEHWQEVPDVAWSYGQPTWGFDSSFVDPDRPDVWFVGPYRSTDAGKTWRKMDGCQGVFSGRGGVLLGSYWAGQRDGSGLVASTDGGERWRLIASSCWTIDADYEADSDTAYLAGGNRLLRVRGVRDRRSAEEGEVLDTPVDQFGSQRIQSVSLDPRRPRTLYAAQHQDTYSASISAVRSDDGGDSFVVLNQTEPLTPGRRDPAHLDGGREAQRVRVHPQTGEAWFSSGCYGVWRRSQ